MESKNEFKKLILKIADLKVVDTGFDNTLLDQKLYKNILYKAFMSAKPLFIRFDKIDGFIKIFNNGIRYLVLFGPGWHDAIYNRIRYLISEKGGIADSINHNFGRIRIDSYNSLPIEKTLTFHSVMILINC